MKLIKQNVLNTLAGNSANYIALGTISKQVAWQMLQQAGFFFIDGQLRTQDAVYVKVDTKSGEIAFKRV